MRFTKIVLAAAFLTAAAGPALAADEDALVKYRKANMSAVSAHLNSIVAIMKGDVPYTDQLAAHARALAETAKMTEAAFKEKALGMAEQSRAKEEIWSDWGRFSTGATQLRDRTGVLAVAAESGDMGAVGAALGELGQTCKACHDNFRNK